MQLLKKYKELAEKEELLQQLEKVKQSRKLFQKQTENAKRRRKYAEKRLENALKKAENAHKETQAEERWLYVLPDRSVFKLLGIGWDRNTIAEALSMSLEEIQLIEEKYQQ